MSNNLELIVKEQEQSFNSSLSCREISFTQEQQFAIQALKKNNHLFNVAANNPDSLRDAVNNIAAIGISLNPANDHAYLVPRGNMVCLDIGYRGLIHLAVSSGSIKWGQAKIVYSNDEYINNGVDKAPTHKYNSFGDRGNMVGVYCVVKTCEGDYLTEEMSKEQVIQIRDSSRAKSGPWVTWFDEMARKSVVKRASKYWPKVERLNRAIEYLNNEGGEGLEELSNELPDSYVSQIEDLEEICDVSNSHKAFDVDSVYELRIDQADQIINRLKQTRELMPKIRSIKKAIEGESWIIAYDELQEMTNEEKQLVWVAPTKGGVFTTQERKIIKEDLRTLYNEAVEEALDQGILNEEGTKL